VAIVIMKETQEMKLRGIEELEGKIDKLSNYAYKVNKM
jgi:hypothetical protein